MDTDESGRDSAVGRAREAYDRKAWRTAYSEYAAADRYKPLGPDDLERFGTTAFLTGMDAESVEMLTRAHHEFMNRGDAESAARCGMRLGLRMFMNGEVARGTGWLSRARRVLDESGRALPVSRADDDGKSRCARDLRFGSETGSAEHRR